MKLSVEHKMFSPGFFRFVETPRWIWTASDFKWAGSRWATSGSGWTTWFVSHLTPYRVPSDDSSFQFAESWFVSLARWVEVMLTSRLQGRLPGSRHPHRVAEHVRRHPCR